MLWAEHLVADETEVDVLSVVLYLQGKGKEFLQNDGEGVNPPSFCLNLQKYAHLFSVYG